MTRGVSFQTRARAIDHLGRGQIADAPTAISELWKNAYDAYARNVALHIFDGDPPVAAIFDDGVGMSHEDILNRWLVIGTESKIEDFDLESTETFGLPARPRQGEKGIGRLSAAFLAPATVLISKRSDSQFVAVVVDWRLFENPFLALDDIRLPVEQFASPEALVKGLPKLLKTLTANLGGDNTSRGKRLIHDWERFSKYEIDQGFKPTAQSISTSWNTIPLTRRHLEEWPVFLELAGHGTAMFMIDLNHELRVWVTPTESGEEVEEVKARLRQTLTGFTDPYSNDRPEFDYEVFTHRGEELIHILSASDIFGLHDLHELEHYIDGRFDEKGTFTGKVKAFGEDLGMQTFIPKRPLFAQGRNWLGPFEFTIGTFEMDERRSTHNENQHALLGAKTEKFAGISVYRDFLRVMPYGRPDADFLGLEERRGKSAGREFWAHRRCFGRIGVSRSENPALKDKAGREGLVDNRAFREMRLLVVEFLMDAARKYFGTDSPIREEMLPEIMARKLRQKEAALKARSRRRKSIRQFLREQSDLLDETLMRADNLVALSNEVLSEKDHIQATVLLARENEIRSQREQLRPPTPPTRLGDLETQWRAYRDDYTTLVEKLEVLARLTAEVDAALKSETPKGVLEQRYEERSIAIQGQLDAFIQTIDQRLENLKNIWHEHRAEDVEEIEVRIGHLLKGNITSDNLLVMLNLLDANSTELTETFSGRYPPFINVLDQLIEGIDLEGAYAITEDDRADLDEKLRDIYAIAQIGITVEIIGHELETLESEVRRHLNKLTKEVQDTNAFKSAMRSHLSLSDRLRFLSPMKIGGYRARETITGEQIADYIQEFFASSFREQRIEFFADIEFQKISIIDIPSRIFPVFINLVNNAIYWTSLSEERNIRLGFEDGLVMISDTGPGIDPEDLPRIFDIFFSRRKSGRGIGLYLCRANLAVAGHKIRYATSDDPTLLNGANFVIEFKGVQTNG